MIAIQAELAEKRREAAVLFELINKMSNQPGSVLQVAILKSSFLILLYNIVESTLTSVLERIHEVASREFYSKLAPTLKILWFDYFFIKRNDKERRINLDMAIKGEGNFPKLTEFQEKITLFSGNLDGRALHDLLVKYGIGILSTPDRDQLRIIKEKRNKIAHGEETFSSSCRGFTMFELQALSNACFAAMESVVSQASTYITERKFLENP